MDLDSDLLENVPLECEKYVVGEVGIEDSLPFSDESRGSRHPQEDSSDDSIDFSQPIKKILLQFNDVVCKRLDSMDARMDDLSKMCSTLEDKVDTVAAVLKRNDVRLPNSWSPESERSIASRPAIVVDVADGHVLDGELSDNGVQLLQLNSEESFPDGSWLGDEENPEMRVRCKISPTDMFHLNVNCHTAEKMSLTLLDYLFDRDEQAISNISGNGKNKKKKLDPLMIYGIRCHLAGKFGTTEKDWHRIKQNLDSKCRTAYRRKIRGLPNVVKRMPARHGKTGKSEAHDVAGGDVERVESTSSGTDLCDLEAESSDATEGGSGSDFSTVSNQVIQTPDGPIQIQIQFLSENGILMSDDMSSH